MDSERRSAWVFSPISDSVTQICQRLWATSHSKYPGLLHKVTLWGEQLSFFWEQTKLFSFSVPCKPRKRRVCHLQNLFLYLSIYGNFSYCRHVPTWAHVYARLASTVRRKASLKPLTTLTLTLHELYSTSLVSQCRGDTVGCVSEKDNVLRTGFVHISAAVTQIKRQNLWWIFEFICVISFFLWRINVF